MSDTGTVEVEVEVPEAGIPADEVAEIVDSALDHVVEAVTDESEHDANVELIGSLVATALSAVTSRLDRIEAQQMASTATAEVALDAAIDALDSVDELEAEAIEAEEVAEEVIDELPELVEDSPPPTLRSRFNQSWFR